MDEDKGKSKKWRKEKSKDDGRADLRLHRAETAHVSCNYYVIVTIVRASYSTVVCRY